MRNHQNITEIRDVISKYGENAKIHLGGIPMIADDMMSFIKSDIMVFGFGDASFVILSSVSNRAICVDLFRQNTPSALCPHSFKRDL